MTEKAPDLVVDPAELKALAQEQDRASSDITHAKDDISGLVGNLRKDHGLICTELVNAMKALEGARAEAANNMSRVSELLAENLNTAADSYSGVDKKTGDNIDVQVRH